MLSWSVSWFGVDFISLIVGSRTSLGLMASKIQQLQSKACQASQFLSKHGTTYYKQLLEQNKQYIVEPPTVEKCNELSKQLLYTRLARLYSLQPNCLISVAKLLGSVIVINEFCKSLPALTFF